MAGQPGYITPADVGAIVEIVTLDKNLGKLSISLAASFEDIFAFPDYVE